jgi:four helix bundle protein
MKTNGDGNEDQKDENQSGHPKPWDLEERTFQFAKRVRAFIKKVPMTLTNTGDCRQLSDASGSVGANYREANEALSKKDFVMRIKICRKEAKESHYWLRLIDTCEKPDLEAERTELVQEAWELTKIFGSICHKSGG